MSQAEPSLVTHFYDFYEFDAYFDRDSVILDLA